MDILTPLTSSRIQPLTIYRRSILFLWIILGIGCQNPVDMCNCSLFWGWPLLKELVVADSYA